MELSERKKQILKAIIGDYIRTAEPVGSKSRTLLRDESPHRKAIDCMWMN